MRALSLEAARAHTGRGAWLDARTEPAFAAGHAPGAGNIPGDEWDGRRAELPPRDAEVIVVAEDAARAADAARRLEASGYTRVAYLDAPGSAPDLAADRSPAARLWRPAPFLEEVVGSIPPGRALDVACGSGRDAVYLAIRGFDVEAWDLDADALDAAARLARRHGVGVRTRRVDLEGDPPEVPAATFDVVVCFRFLHRPLLPLLERALSPGGHLVYETFREGQERFGRPRRPRFLLRAGELRTAFSGLDVLRYEEPDPPAGPVTARLLARRPGGPAR